MEVNAVLNEQDLARDIVCSFLKDDQTLVVIETDCVRFYKRCSRSDAVADYDVRCCRLNGYTIAASHFRDSLTSVQYVILLKSHGVLEIRDTELKLVDTLELTDIELNIVDTREIFFSFDEGNRHMFINLEPCIIYQVSLQWNNSTLRFVKTDQSLVPVTELNYPIVSMDVASCFDVYSGEEMVVIPVVSRDTAHSQFYFKAVFSTAIYSKRKHTKKLWKILIPSRELQPRDDSTSSEFSQALLKTVPNIGFFVFTPDKTFVFPIPGGYGVCINGCKVEDYYEMSGIYADGNTPNLRATSPKLFPHILSNSTLHSVEFHVIDGSASLITISIEKLVEDEDEFIIYWGNFAVKKKFMDYIKKGSSPYEYETMASKSFYLGCGYQYLLQLMSDELLWVDLASNSMVLSLPFNCVNYVYSAAIGYDVPSIVRTGFTTGGKYFIDKLSVDHSVFISMSKLYELGSHQLENMWCAHDDNIWWLDSEMNLYKNGELSRTISSSASGFFVARDGTFVQGDSSTLKIVEVSTYGDDKVSYCILSRDGISLWRGNDCIGSQGFPIGIKGSDKLESAVFLPVRSRDGDEFLFYAIDNKLTVVKNQEIFGQITFLDDQLDTISSMCYQTLGDKVSYLCVGDVYGKLCIIDVSEMVILDLLRVNFHPIKLISLPFCGLTVVYSEDMLILMTPSRMKSDGSRFKFVRLDIPLNTKQLVAGTTDGTLVLATTDNSIYKLCIDLEKLSFNEGFSRNQIDVLITKFVQLPCSQRYIVGSYIQSREHNKSIPSTGLCVVDLLKGTVVQRLDISSIYPETSVTDIIPVPHVPMRMGTRKVLFAKQLIFDQCLLVSLSYEMSESDVLENILLLLFDNDRIELEVKATFDTGYNVTGLYNHLEDSVIVTGESTQIFELNYSVKENIFTIKPNSFTKLTTGGYIYSLFPLCRTDRVLTQNVTKIKRSRANSEMSQIFLGLDLFRGLVEFNTKVTEPSASSDLVFEIDYVPMPLRIPPLQDISHQELITHFAVCHAAGMSWFGLCCGPNLIEIYVAKVTQSEDLSEEYKMFQFSLSNQVTSLTAVGQNSDRRSYTRSLKEATIIDLFLITTLNNGHYVLNTVIGGNKDQFLQLVTSKEQRKQLISIGSLDKECDDSDDENGVLFIDNRPFGTKSLKK